MKSKIIQITSFESGQINHVLCEDGSIWEFRHHKGGDSKKTWVCIFDPEIEY